MRAFSVVALACLGACLGACRMHGVAPPRGAPAAALARRAPSAEARLPRYFPRTPARVAVLGHTDEGTIAMHGAMRLLLRADEGLPDAAPHRIASSSTATPEGAGTPTGSHATSTLAVPARLGGGWLFVVGRELWHAPSWLARPRRMFQFVSPPRVHLGLDGVVAQEAGRAPFAFRVADGQSMPLDHWPDSPAIAELATRDAKHAAVVADLRGLSITEDGGQSWREIATTRTPIGVRPAAGGYVVRGRNGSDDHEVAWRIDLHGETRGDMVPCDPASRHDVCERAAGKPDLRSASSGAWERVLEHGYDDAAHDRYVVFDHGVLERYRKSDGALLGRSRMGSASASCRPIHWPSARPGSEPGFACTDATSTSLWKVADHDATEVMRLFGRRRVWSSEVGTLALEGPCENDRVAPQATTLCVWGRRSSPETVRLQGASPADLLLPLRDGSVVVLRPPSGPAAARRAAELFVDAPAPAPPSASGRLRGLPLRPRGALEQVLARHLAEGHWLGDLEALEGGGFAGWIEHEGHLLGVRVARDGQLEVGPRSAVATTHRVAGARSLSWSTGGAGFESTDGGMHYTQIGLPASESGPATPPRGSRSEPSANHAGAIGCTAIGCILPTMLRVGWGADLTGGSEPDRPTASPSVSLSAGRIVLDCSLVARSHDAQAKPTPIRIVPHASRSSVRPPYGYGAIAGTLSFHGSAPPKVRADQVLQSWDTVDLADRRSHTFLGRVYQWGSLALGAAADAGWQWRWFDPRTHSVHATALARAPDELSLAHPMQSSMGMARVAWSIAMSPDPRQALGIASDGARALVFSLLEGEAPAAIELADGGSFGALESALAVPGDRAVLAGPVGDPAATAIYLARGARAERVARVARLGVQGKPSPAHLALHSDGVRIAIAVEDRDVASRSDAAFYLREAYPSDGPVRRYGLAPAAAGESRTLRVCKDDAAGFDGWVKLDLAGEIRLAGGGTARLASPTRAKLRFRDDGALCLVEAASGVDAEGTTALGAARIATPTASTAMPMTVDQAGRHFTLACSSK